MRYAIAPHGVFWSIQGEGHLRGQQMAFLRLAGCSVNCIGCDTDYTVADRVDLDTLVQRVAHIIPANARDKWVWITGGEPTDHDLGPLIRELRRGIPGVSIAVATSGKRRVIPPVDWLSVTYHGGYELAQRFGHELKLVDGLNDYGLSKPPGQLDFMQYYCQPLSVCGTENAQSLERCLEWLKDKPNWGLSRQDHHVWNVS